MPTSTLFDFNHTVFNISLRKNCSTYNPCGSHGYCHDNTNEWTCICKYWWYGTTCNELSNSGKQVIALGIITGVLMCIFYGLGLYFWIVKKRQQKDKDKCADKARNRRIIRQRSAAPPEPPEELFWLIKPWISILGTLTLAILSLAIKGIFITTTKRESTGIKKLLCAGYIDLPVPLDFYASVKRMFAAVTFALFAYDLSSITKQLLLGTSPTTDGGIIVTYLLQIVKILAIGFRCYPMLAAVYINTRFALIIAMLYSWFDFGMNIAFQGICQNDYYASNDNYNEIRGIDTRFYLNYYGTGSTLVFVQLLSNSPHYLFLAYISIEMPLMLYQCIRFKEIEQKKLTRAQENLLYSSLRYSAEFRYVKNLFEQYDADKPVNRLIYMVQSIYKWRRDFRFSARILCAYSSAFCLLFFLTVEICVQVLPYLDELQTGLQALINFIFGRNELHNSNLYSMKYSSSNVPVPNLIRPWLFAIFIGVTTTVIQLFVLLANIRRNLLQAFRGDDSEVPRRNNSKNVDYACENIHFAGYLIGYSIWSFLLITFFTFAIGTLIDIVITYELVEQVQSIARILIPPALFAIFQLYTNRILAQYVFLQHAGDSLAIKNRRILMIFLYFNFFLDAFFGLVTSVVRALKNAVFRLIYMCRLDCSSMGRKLEMLETGFGSYCGFIHMECAHRHPIVLFFAGLLLDQNLNRTSSIHCSRAKRRWHVAYFLIKNPLLVHQRKIFLIRLLKHRNDSVAIENECLQELHSSRITMNVNVTQNIVLHTMEETMEVATNQLQETSA